MAIAGELRQSTAVTIPLGKFVDATDGVTAETALTISQADVLLSKNGATFAQKSESSASSHMQRGYYACALNSTDTNTLGILSIDVEESGALPVRQDYAVLTADEWDRKYANTGAVAAQGIVARGVPVSATSTTAVLAAGESGLPNDTVVGCVLGIYDATNKWQFRPITDWVASTQTATVDAWQVTPSSPTLYVMYVGTPGSASERTAIAHAVVEAEIDALETYNRTSNTAATITGPTNGATTLTITTDAAYEPIKSIS